MPQALCLDASGSEIPTITEFDPVRVELQTTLVKGETYEIKEMDDEFVRLHKFPIDYFVRDRFEIIDKSS